MTLLKMPKISEDKCITNYTLERILERSNYLFFELSNGI